MVLIFKGSLFFLLVPLKTHLKWVLLRKALVVGSPLLTTVYTQAKPRMGSRTENLGRSASSAWLLGRRGDCCFGI